MHDEAGFAAGGGVVLLSGGGAFGADGVAAFGGVVECEAEELEEAFADGADGRVGGVLVEAFDGLDVTICRGLDVGQVKPLEEGEDAPLGRVGVGCAREEHGEREAIEDGLGEQCAIGRVKGRVGEVGELL